MAYDWESGYVYSMKFRTTAQLIHYRKCLGTDRMSEPKRKREILTKRIAERTRKDG